MRKFAFSLLVVFVISGCGNSKGVNILPVPSTAVTGVTDFTRTSIHGSGSAVADGASAITVTVILQNTDGSFEAGYVPTWTAPEFGVHAASCSASDANGVSICSVKASFPGTKTFTLLNGKVGLTQSLTFTADVSTPGTNLLTNANDLTHTDWSQTQASSSLNTAIRAPDGSATVYEFFDNSASTNHGLIQSITLPAGTYTQSLYIKPGTLTGTSIRVYNFSSESHAEFVLGNAVPSYDGTYGDFSSISQSMIQFTDGWYRYAVTFSVATSNTVAVRYFLQNGSTDNYSGTGTDSSYLWKPKLESGLTATRVP